MDADVQRFPAGLVFKAHRLLYHSTRGSRVIKKKEKSSGVQRRGIDARSSKWTLPLSRFLS